MKFRFLKKLGDRGSAHYVLPLLAVLVVGVVGTYMLVASHADSVPPNATLLVFSAGGSYTSMSITSDHSFKSARCGTHDLSSGAVIAKFKVSNNTPVTSSPIPSTVDIVNHPPLTLACTIPPVGHGYDITFLPKASHTWTAPITITPIADTCLYVHAAITDAPVTHSVQRVNNHCTPNGEPDPVAKVTSAEALSSKTQTGGVRAPTPAPVTHAANPLTPVISVSFAGVNSKGATVFGSLKLPKGANNKTACTDGTVTVSVLNSKKVEVTTLSSPLYWENSHCNYRAGRTDLKMSKGSYTINVHFSGNAKLTPSNHSVLKRTLK